VRECGLRVQDWRAEEDLGFRVAGKGSDPRECFHGRKPRLVVKVTQERHKVIRGIIVRQEGPERLDNFTLHIDIWVR